MWKLFLAKNPGVVCSLHLYRDVFNKDFNLRFGVPRSDTCAYCDRLYVQMLSAKSENELKAVETESKIHHMRADLAYKSLARDASISKENRNTVVVCVDQQQVLFCPNLTHNNVFYQRQLSCYNLAISNQANNKSMMFFWDETVGKRGAAEVSSCILKYIEIHFTPLKPGEARVLIFWSDRCIGQNNNWQMIALMQYLVVGKYFSSVEQKFMTTGHSFLPCDRNFAVIERAKKRAKVYAVSYTHLDVYKRQTRRISSIHFSGWPNICHQWYYTSDSPSVPSGGRNGQYIMSTSGLSLIHI